MLLLKLRLIISNHCLEVDEGPLEKLEVMLSGDANTLFED